MFPTVLALPAPLPLALDLTLEFGPVLLLALLALLDLSAVAVIHAALVSRSNSSAARSTSRATVLHLRSGQAEGEEASPPSRAA